MTMTDETFWCVWNPDNHNPVVKHPSEHSATQEAERLAMVNPGQMFIVLESICARRVDNMQRITMRSPPF